MSWWEVFGWWAAISVIGTVLWAIVVGRIKRWQR